MSPKPKRNEIIVSFTQININTAQVSYISFFNFFFVLTVNYIFIICYLVIAKLIHTTQGSELYDSISHSKTFCKLLRFTDLDHAESKIEVLTHFRVLLQYMMVNI